MTFIEEGSQVSTTEKSLQVDENCNANCNDNCNFIDNVVVEKKRIIKKQPYLKRKSIRVDLLLKGNQEKKVKKQVTEESLKKPVETTQGKQVEELETSESKAFELIHILHREKKQLENELMVMKGKYSQMEEMFKEMTLFYQEQLRREYAKGEKSHGDCCECEKKQAQVELKPKKILIKKKAPDSIEECTKCHKHFKAKYMKYHGRVCGNLKMKYLLSERDLVQLETAKLNMQTNHQLKYEFDWRKRRGEFKKQVEEAKLKKNFIILYKRK